MTAIDFSALSQPVSETEPCGPDLDLAGDPDYMNFLAAAEGLLPALYFAFDAASVDFDAQFETLGKLLKATRDIRLLTLAAKLSALRRDLDGFAGSVEAIASLLQGRWEEVHPRIEDGNAGAREASLKTLDDNPTVVLPLQYMPLVVTERLGAISFRSAMIAAGEVKARTGEQAFDPASLEKGLMEADFDKLMAVRNRVVTLRDGLKRIRDVSVERVGFEQAVRLDLLPPLVGKILALLEGAITKRDPTAIAPPATAAAGESAAGESAAATPAARTAPSRIRTIAEAAQALAAAAGYFSRLEPSSPALLLVRQAQQLIGKSFVDVMRILVPARVDEAKVQIGAEQTFSLTLKELSAVPAAGGADSAAAPASGDGAAQQPIEAATRQAAMQLLDDVGSYYRTMEPSSPIPLLTDRARGLVERDFLYLLKDLLPEPPPPPPKK